MRTHTGCHGQQITCPGCPEALGAGAGESLGLERISLTQSHMRTWAVVFLTCHYLGVTFLLVKTATTKNNKKALLSHKKQRPLWRGIGVNSYMQNTVRLSGCLWLVRSVRRVGRSTTPQSCSLGVESSMNPSPAQSHRRRAQAWCGHSWKSRS